MCNNLSNPRFELSKFESLTIPEYTLSLLIDMAKNVKNCQVKWVNELP